MAPSSRSRLRRALRALACLGTHPPDSSPSLPASVKHTQDRHSTSDQSIPVPLPAQETPFARFSSRRSVVHSTKGIVASTQPLATQAGLQILREGGNAADAAVAVAAALNITEPSSTGIGGDMFCLYYDAKTNKVHSLNGSGRAGANMTLDRIRADLGLSDGQSGKIPMTSVHAVSVPGAAAGWVDCVEKFGSGKLTLEQILAPAIELGEKGFPVSELSARFWKSSEHIIKAASPNASEMLRKDPSAPGGCRAPVAGELFHNPTLANTFRLLGKHGKKGFYEGDVAEALVKVVTDLGGHLTLDDLKHHAETGSEETEAISLKFTGQNVTRPVELWEHPPNGQGIVALMALGIIQELEKVGKIGKWSTEDHNSAEHLHAVIEALRIAFADANWWVADPKVVKVPTQSLISSEYLATRAKLFSSSTASAPLSHGSPAHNHCDTVYFACTDSFGNGISFINSNYGGFGTAIIPKGCGFTLQNRAANFALQPLDHPNILQPRKRTYHTIIPALITNPEESTLHTVYGVMGGFMQPQGHLQVFLNMLVFNLNPQEALDAPRICIGAGMPELGDVRDRTVYLEEGIREEVVAQLKKLGHQVKVLKGHDRGMFGRGQVIQRHTDEGVLIWSAGSDQRGDGAAMPQ